MSLRCSSDIFATPTTRVHRHVSNLPRLFRILSVSAKFRLYEFAEGQSGYLLLRLLLLPFSLRHLFSVNAHNDRNVRLRFALQESLDEACVFRQSSSLTRFLRPHRESCSSLRVATRWHA